MRVFFVVPIASLCLFGCQHKVCGPNMEIDSEPLPAAWSDVAPPTDAKLCGGSHDYADARFFDAPAKTQAEAFEKWSTSLEAKGWQEQPLTQADLDEIIHLDPDKGGKCLASARYRHGDALLKLFSNQCGQGGPGLMSVSLIIPSGK